MMKRALEPFVVVALACVGTIVLTWPLAAGFGSLGRVRLTDGRWSIWVVSWVAHALTTAPLSLYNANIFYPHAEALAFSEANLAGGVIASPVLAATRNPLAAHNTALVAAFVLAAVAAYSLGRHLTGNRTAAALTGVVFGFCPYAFSHTAHSHLMMTAGLPLTLLLLHRLIERPTPARSAWLGVAIAAQAVSSGYYGILAGFVAVAGILFFAIARGEWRNRRYWGAAMLAAAVTVAVTAPFFIPYLQVQRANGFSRNLVEARIFSADWRSYLTSPARAHAWMLPLVAGWKEVLFPGFIGTVLALIGVGTGLNRDRGEAHSSRREIVLFYVVAGLLALWLSIGPAGGLYTLLFNTLPVFSFLRAPSRFGILVTLAVAVLAGIGLDALMRNRSAQVRRALVVVPILALAELNPAPVAWDRMPEVPRVYRVLATLPRGPVAEFPFYGGARDVEFNAVYMLFSTYHWQPLVNGYSDNIPPDFYTLATTLRGFPSAEAFRALRRVGTRYLVVHVPRYAPEQRPAIVKGLEPFASQLTLLVEQDTIRLYELR